MMKLRESLFLEKQQALESTRSELEQDKRESSQRADELVSVLMTEHANLLAVRFDTIGKITKINNLEVNCESRVRS